MKHPYVLVEREYFSTKGFFSNCCVEDCSNGISWNLNVWSRPQSDLFQDLNVLVERCRDPALSVRKQAMQCLTDLLLSMPTEKPLQQ